MKYRIFLSTKYRKDFKQMVKRNYDISLLDSVIEYLEIGKTLPEKHRDHALTGSYIGYRECHIMPDWLLVYKIEDDILILTLLRTGTHSDLF